MKSHGDIMKGYGDIMKSYKREREGAGTIGLDWLGRGWREGWREGWGIPAELIFSAWPIPHSSPHPPLPNPFSSSYSTPI